MRTISFFLFVIFLFTQCEAPDIQQKDARTFYNLKAFLDKEKVRLIEHKIVLEKQVVLNGKVEEQSISNPDYDVEFSEFYTSDINKVAWLDKYDEVKEGGTISYSSLDDKLEVKKMIVSGSEGDKIIKIRKSTENSLNYVDKELTYKASEGYSIKSVRKSIGSSADTIEILVRF